MRKISPRTELIAALVLFGIGTLARSIHPPENPDALWQIVATQCLPNQAQHNDPAPCAKLDTAQGYAILKDKKGDSQFLLIPTAQSPGIEDPALLDPTTPNYFAVAWNARSFSEGALKKQMPRQEMGLAINSEKGRTQNQLHIHIDCLDRGVRNILRVHRDEIAADKWTTLSIPLKDHTYSVRRVDGETLDGVNPFALAAELPGAKGDMGDETLAIAGAVFAGGRPGFVLLADHADPDKKDHASSAELLDHACKAAHEFAP